MKKKERQKMKQTGIVTTFVFASILVATVAFAGASCCTPGQGAPTQAFTLFPQVAPTPQPGVPAAAVGGAPASCCPQYSGARGCRASSARTGGCCGAAVNPAGCCGPAVNQRPCCGGNVSAPGCCPPSVNPSGCCPPNASPRGCCPPNVGAKQSQVPSTSGPMVAPQATLAVNCCAAVPRGTLGELW
jgi:hypothetical protein